MGRRAPRSWLEGMSIGARVGPGLAVFLGLTLLVGGFSLHQMTAKEPRGTRGAATSDGSTRNCPGDLHLSFAAMLGSSKMILASLFGETTPR